ncbi:zinc-binding dehydrogenase [Rhodobacteraceae bacterium]|nr:zinc-binding dehydrogenase [Paracoccaceae bacterium]
MKSIYFPAQGEVALRNQPSRAVGPREVRVKVRAAGLCHTDYEVRAARYGSGAFPIVPGHEFAGEVIEIGNEVQGFSTGDRVVIDPNLSCGSCRSCLRGRENLCVALGAYGVSKDGGFAEEAIIYAGNLHKTELPWTQAALAEPMGCVLNAVEALRPAAHDETLIIGAGPIGILLAIALHTRGVERITLADLSPERLALAESFGFASVEAGSAKMQSLRGNMDIAADATGVTQVASGLTGYLVDAGAALFFGVCPPDALIEVSPFEVFRRQLRLMGTHSLNRNIPQALAAITAYGPKIEGLVSHQVALEEMAVFLGAHPPKASLKIQAVMS